MKWFIWRIPHQLYMKKMKNGRQTAICILRQSLRLYATPARTIWPNVKKNDDKVPTRVRVLVGIHSTSEKTNISGRLNLISNYNFWNRTAQFTSMLIQIISIISSVLQFITCWASSTIQCWITVKNDTHWGRRHWEWLQKLTFLSGIWRCSTPHKTERELWMCPRERAENRTKSTRPFGQTYMRIQKPN